MNWTTWWNKEHTADQCAFETCDYCGCCAHGKEDAKGCKTSAAPVGLYCPNDLCACRGAA